MAASLVAGGHSHRGGHPSCLVERWMGRPLAALCCGRATLEGDVVRGATEGREKDDRRTTEAAYQACGVYALPARLK